MDLLFKRYASPFLLLDSIISCGDLYEFVGKVLEMHNDDILWQFYLHKVFDKSYEEFVAENNQRGSDSEEQENIDFETTVATVTESKKILDEFKIGGGF